MSISTTLLSISTTLNSISTTKILVVKSLPRLKIIQNIPWSTFSLPPNRKFQFWALESMKITPLLHLEVLCYGAFYIAVDYRGIL